MGPLQHSPEVWELTQVIAVAIFLLAVFTAGHALLYKRDTRAVIAWVAMIVMIPAAGAILYWLLAVNRIERRARKLRPQPTGRDRTISTQVAEPSKALAPLAKLGNLISPFRLTPANCVTILENGDGAYPVMLAAIEGAERSITLASYIFDGDATGKRFGDALVAAVGRGVEVRVLVDAHGRRNRHDDMARYLARKGVTVAKFMPLLFSSTLAAFNLRNHRKLLVVDGRLAFTGGMNISGDNVLADKPAHPVRDLHFAVEGPAVEQVQHVFVEDWEFTTGERLEGEPWFMTRNETRGTVLVRAVPDGPDEHFESLKLIIQGALAQARSSVAVMTPYFLPDQSLIAALNTAAMRGIEVDILLPSVNDHRVVQWASQALFWQLLERGCRIWLSPAPFDHSKLLLVDDEWALVGSTNWDPRSLRLNFELNLECHDIALGGELRRWFDRRRADAEAVTLEGMDGRPLPIRLRDGAARLMTPYL